MTVHAVKQADWFARDEPRGILWNDETGEVLGDHSDVPLIREWMADAVRDGGLLVDNGRWRLRDPRHDPASFKVVLMFALMAAFDEEMLPEPLRSADTTAMFHPAPYKSGRFH